MKKGKNYWEPIFEEFIRMYPDLGEQIVDWYPSGQMEITVKIKGGKKYAYDWMHKIMTLLYDPEDEYDETEDEWRNTFGRNLDHKLYNVGKSQDLLAFETGISPVTINKYIKGKATPSTYNLRKIAQALQCSVTELIY